MEFAIKVGGADKHRSACIVLGVFESRKLTDGAKSIDVATEGYVSSVLRTGDMNGKLGTTLLLHNIPHIPCKRILLVGLGQEKEFNSKGFRAAVSSAFNALGRTAVTEVGLLFADIPLKDRDLSWKVSQIAVLANESVYRFDVLKSKSESDGLLLDKVAIYINDRAHLKIAEKGLAQGKAIAQGMKVAKDLGNLAPNVCTPSYLAKRAVDMSKSHKLKVSVLGQKEMEKLKMGALLAVAKGSHQPAKLIALEYRGLAKSEKPIVLVGKGITFDTGGISLKPAAEMDEMKYDMSGAASVLGTLIAVAEMALPLNVVGIIPTTENMPGGNATKPGDVVTSMSGQTIEILNTDAEGRLILCDALTYAERYNPEAVIDIATLTGACVIALGHVASGLMSNHDQLAEELLQASELSADRAWRLPLWDDYQDLLKSNFADMANIGGRSAGTISAACFLARFAEKYQWAHLDIAGTAWKSGKDKGSTGRPVPLLTQFLISRAMRKVSSESIK